MSERPRILVTGSNGQLGRELRDIAVAWSSYDFLFTSHDDLDITNEDDIKKYFELHHPRFCINAAAYTAVDKAESEKEKAFAVNTEAVRIIALSCSAYNTKLVQVSTDYVFDGTASSPYNEESPTNPVNLYGLSKLKGEEAALSNTDAIVVRTSWVYSRYGNNFVKTMLRLMIEREEISVVNDQLGSPTYAADLAEVIMQMIDFKTWQPGIYHFSNDGVISWFDFAQQIKEFSSSACKINPIPTTSFPTPAKRPAYSVLNKKKIQQVFGVRLKFWVDSLSSMLSVKC